MVWALPINPPSCPTVPQNETVFFLIPRKYSLCTLVFAQAAITKCPNLVAYKQKKFISHSSGSVFSMPLWNRGKGKRSIFFHTQHSKCCFLRVLRHYQELIKQLFLLRVSMQILPSFSCLPMCPSHVSFLSHVLEFVQSNLRRFLHIKYLSFTKNNKECVIGVSVFQSDF